MNNKNALLVRALRPPVLLMTIGSLFAMQQAGRASIERTWPIVLIVVGVMLLLERGAGGTR